MTLTVRLSLRVEQTLAEYCVERKITKSAAVKQAIENLLEVEARPPSAYDLGRDLFGPETDEAPIDDLASNSKRLLREHFRGVTSAKRGRAARR